MCEELAQNAYKQDLMTILTSVSRKVAIEYESNVPGCITMHGQKQVPCIMSQLIRLVQFTKAEYGGGPSNFK